MNYAQLFEQIQKKKSFLCVGLDTDINKIPSFLKELDDPVFEFNKRIIDATNE
jgi:orotidine-5'-phosphate decarboxylase